MRARQGMRIAAGLVAGGVLSLGVATLGGCGLMDGLAGDLTGGVSQEFESIREEAARARDEIAADRIALEQSAAELPRGSGARARVESIAVARATQEAAFARAVERLEALAGGGTGEGPGDTSAPLDPAGTLEDGAALLAPLVPPGAQLPLILGAGFAASVWRAARLKKSAASIARGLEKAMAGDEGLREGMKRNADTLRSVQTATAQRIVDEVKRARPMVRLPL